MNSEVAQLRQRIERECEALQQLKHGFAQVASHELITHRFEHLGTVFEQLASHVGPQAAIEMIGEKLEEYV